MKKITFLFSVIFLVYSVAQGQFASDTVSQSLKRAYTELANTNMYGVNYWAFGDDRSDIAETGGGGIGDIPDLQNIMIHNVSEDNYEIKKYWYRAFNIISFCNYIVENAQSGGLSTEEQNRMVAEAKFLRALMYFNLANAFDSVPIHTQVFPWPLSEMFKDYNSDNFVTGPFNTMAEVYTQVKIDLKSAMEYLPVSNSLDYENRFRATSGAAKALLGKVYLFESSFAKNYVSDNRFSGMELNWDSALYCTEEVINSAEYALVGGQTYDTWWDTSYIYPESTPAYRYLFTADGNGNTEIIFPAINMTLGQGWTSYGGNGISRYTGVRMISCSNSPLDFGWGWNVPSQKLIDLFAAETGNPKDDARFLVTVGQSGDTVQTNNNGTDLWCAIYFPSDRFVTTACRKYECSREEYNEYFMWYDAQIDIPVIRYADVLLMSAEAALELGNNAKALSYVNMVRMRAQSSGNTGYPSELVNLTINDIVKERALELALEGHRYYDLLRWGLATDYLDGRIIATHDSITAEFQEGTDEFFPIPAGAIGAVSSISTAKDVAFSIYPNPADHYLIIQTSATKNKIEICDVQGRKVMGLNIDETQNRIDISSLSSGIYNIQVLNNEGLSSMKFIKQ